MRSHGNLSERDRRLLERVLAGDNLWRYRRSSIACLLTGLTLVAVGGVVVVLRAASLATSPSMLLGFMTQLCGAILLLVSFARFGHCRLFQIIRSLYCSSDDALETDRAGAGGEERQCDRKE
jgi:hypothetical protein